MKTKILQFPKSKKKPEIIEAEINKIFDKYNLFYAHHMENPASGKVIITLILKDYDPKSKSKIQVKAFRKTKIQEIEADCNKFMSKKDTKVKFFTQSLSSNTILSLVFHEVSRAKTNTDDQATDQSPGEE